MASDDRSSLASVSDLIERGCVVEALRALISIKVEAALKTLRSPRLRGPFPCPSESDLASAAPLRAVADWLRAAAKRSKRTLGPLGVAEALEATGRLEHLADLLAAVEAAPTPQAAEIIATAALKSLLQGP
jgi:hypothetical protein